MTRIYKFPLAEAEITEIPNATRILCIQTQYGKPVVWAHCETDLSLKPTRIASLVTGATPPKNGIYISTTQQDEGRFVLHHYLIP